MLINYFFPSVDGGKEDEVEEVEEEEDFQSLWKRQLSICCNVTLCFRLTVVNYSCSLAV